MTLPVLYLIACGGRPAGNLPPFVTALRADGWDVCVIATPDAVKFLGADRQRLEDLTGHPVRSEFKQPDEPDVLPPADAFIVAPATFNTVNKLAAGISDTLAVALLNEGIGLGQPIVLVPAVNDGLGAHPRYRANLDALRSYGVTVVADQTLARASVGASRDARTAG